MAICGEKRTDSCVYRRVKNVPRTSERAFFTNLKCSTCLVITSVFAAISDIYKKRQIEIMA